jgi:tetratricopeptide (TPR) repeat protein
MCAAVILLAGLSACGPRTAEEHLQRAREYAAHHDLRSAVIELKNALQKSPDLAEARLMLGEADLALGDLESARKELARALSLGIATDRAMPALLETRADLGQTQDVLAALADLPPTPRYRALRGQLLLATGDRDGAQREFAAAMEDDPKLPRAYLGMARLAASGPTADPAQVRAILTRGTAALPENRDIWLALGELGVRQSARAARLRFSARPRARVGELARR